MKLNRYIFSGIFAAILILSVAHKAAAQSIRLRPTATVDAGTLRVGDVATITGLDQATADKFAQAAILTTNQSVTIRAEQVLFAIISENGNSATTSQLQVNGPVECVVDIAGGSGTAQSTEKTTNAGDTLANRSIATATATEVMPAIETTPTVAKSDPTPPKATTTLAELITAQVVEQLGVAREEVRISFDTASPLLDQPVAGDAHWVIRPLGHNFLGTLEWDTQLVQGAQPRHHLNVQTMVLQHTTVLIAQDNIRPGDVITERQIKTQEHWLDRKITTLFSKPEDVIGQMALPARGIGAGTMLDQRDFKPVTMAVNGDLVTVYLINGGLTIKDQARAIGSGRLHETIKLRSDGNGNDKPGAEYQATLIGRDVAVVGLLDPVIEAKLKELR